jgi:CheY-like chemotaxis protein
VGEIRKAGARAASLTRQLLAFSRKQVLQPKVLDLSAVAAGTSAMLRRLIGKDIELVASLQPRPGRVRADPNQVEQVLVNLAVNARDAMPAGGLLTIETRDVELPAADGRGPADAAPGPYVRLAVKDTGSGMEADTLAHLFEPFFTTKGPGSGTGLGLSMVYGIVKQSGGHLAVRSAPGAGSTFGVYLPRVDEPLDPLAEPVELPARASATSESAQVARESECVLLVEDQDMVREFTRAALEVHGHVVLEASSGDEALLASGRHPGTIDLLLTDVMLPRMSGIELSRRLAAARPGLRLLFMSGFTDGATTAALTDAAFIQKPFTASSLLRRVRDVLDAAPRQT